jgi:two-component system, OmpR family, sensor histidine kinase ResE
MQHKHHPRRLRSQLILTFLAGFLGIGVAIGVPVIILVNRQASSQAQFLLDQTVIASRAFIASERSDLQNLALLVSQRPTLTQLIGEKDYPALERYLDTLREGAHLDSIMVCDRGKEVTGTNKNASMAELCLSNTRSGYAIVSSTNELYLYAAADFSISQNSAYKVIVGKRTSIILAELQEETGLLYFLVRQNQVINSSDPTIETPTDLANNSQNSARQSLGSSLAQGVVRINNHRYLLATLEIEPALDINLVSALNVENQLAIQQSLSNTLLLGLFFIILIASGLGIWQSQRISQPIVNVANAAAKFRQGDLKTQVSVESSIWEISQLANSLEDARIALQHSMEQLQAEKAWIEQLLNSIVEGMLTLDSQNRVTFASAGVGKILECGVDQIIGRKADDIFLSAEGESAFTSQLPSAGQQRRASVKLNSGQERLLSISKANFIPPEAGSKTRALVIRDVTNEEYIHRLLGDFMANITHEFRTPLAALEASSELLLDNLKSLSQAEIEELLVSLNLGITNLQALIDNLIEAASIEAGRFKVSLQPISFDAILREAQEFIQPLAKKYALRLDILTATEPVIVLADQRRTVQVLVNLLSNAIKHSPENGLIQVNHFIDDGKLHIEVVDEGGGIPMEQRDNLFRRFAHLDVPNERAKQGAGLGLSVVKEIVEAQRGEVGFTDLPNGGTSFWFTLPLVNGSQA